MLTPLLFPERLPGSLNANVSVCPGRILPFLRLTPSHVRQADTRRLSELALLSVCSLFDIQLLRDGLDVFLETNTACL